MVPPGNTLMLYSNNFRLGLANRGYVYMYTVNWGAQIGERDADSKREIYKNLREEFRKTFGVYLPYGNNIFALVDLR